jgi:hypothetical protein
MLRTLENSRIIWNVWNAQMRVKILVPIGTQSEAKARTRLSELRGMYKEELTIDDQSGEVNYNGQPQFSFAKTFVIPTKDGEQTEIDGFQPQGYDLSDTESLKYFLNRFINETKVPSSRFNTGDEGGAIWQSSADGIAREEMRFGNFINRIRSMYQEILLKPTWLQFVIKHPEFSKDQSLRTVLGLRFNEENFFKLAKERDIAEKGAGTVSQLMGITQQTVAPDGTQTEEPYFDPKFLVEKYMELNDSEIALNLKYKEQRRDELKKLADAYARINKAKGEEGEGGGDFGGGDFGGGGFEEPFGGEEDLGDEIGGGEGGGFEPEAGGEEEL